MVDHNAPNGVTSQGYLVARKLRQDGVPVAFVSQARSGWGRLLDVAFRGSALCLSRDVLLVSVFGHKAFLYESLAILYGRVLRKRVVAMMRGGWLPEFVQHHLRWTRFVLSQPDLLLTPHEFLRERLSGLGIRVHGVIPNFVEIDKYQFRLRSRPAPRFLYLRGLHAIYNPEMALHAFALVQQVHPQAMLTIAGPEYDQRARIEAMIDDLGLRNVRLLGVVPKAAIPSLANEHDIYIQTPRVDNMPVSVIEVWASGLPVISTNIGGVPYLIRDGVDGLLVPVEDSRAMAEQCLELLADCEKAERLSQNGRGRALEYAWESVAPSWYSALMTSPI